MKRWALLWPAENPRCHSFALGRLPGGPVRTATDKAASMHWIFRQIESWMISNHSHSFYLFEINSCWTVLHKFSFQLYPTVTVQLTWFSRRCIGSARSKNCQERRQVFPQIKPYCIPSLKSPGCHPSTTYHLPKLGTNHHSSPFLSAEPSRHHKMHPPDCWRPVTSILLKAVMNQTWSSSIHWILSNPLSVHIWYS